MMGVFYRALEWTVTIALVAACVVAVGSLTGCTVHVVVAPNATLSIDSDLSQNASQELEREYQ